MTEKKKRAAALAPPRKAGRSPALWKLAFRRWRAADVKQPVSWVRATYDSHAVETKQQKAYVEEFDVKPLQRRLFWYAWHSRVFWWL